MWVRYGVMLVVLGLAGCQDPAVEGVAGLSRPATPQAAPELRWAHRPEAAEWTDSTVLALKTQGAPLLTTVPTDIGEWCPAYPDADRTDRAYFWTGLLSALAEYESNWRPEAAGGGGAWIGLMQISPRTAQAYDCSATSAAALKDGSENLACAVRIMSASVARDGVISQGRGGLAADWTPMRHGAKRDAMAAWTRAQPYCKG